jgi:hypothetical protein
MPEENFVLCIKWEFSAGFVAWDMPLQATGADRGHRRAKFFHRIFILVRL